MKFAVTVFIVALAIIGAQSSVLPLGASSWGVPSAPLSPWGVPSAPLSPWGVPLSPWGVSAPWGVPSPIIGTKVISSGIVGPSPLLGSPLITKLG